MFKTVLGAALIAMLSFAGCGGGSDDNGKGGSVGSGIAGAGGRAGSGVAGNPGVAGSRGGSPGVAGGSGVAGQSGVAGSGGNTVAGVSRSKTVSSLTTAEKTALCDWYAPQVGGYGAAATCSMALIGAPADQASCLADFPTCSATVGNLADCFAKVGAAQMTCTNVQGTAAGTPACLSAASCL
jgi:pilus assembly protein FimV